MIGKDSLVRFCSSLLLVCGSKELSDKRVCILLRYSCVPSSFHKRGIEAMLGVGDRQ